MLAWEWKPTRQPSRSSPSATVTTTMAPSMAATRSSKAGSGTSPIVRNDVRERSGGRAMLGAVGDESELRHRHHAPPAPGRLGGRARRLPGRLQQRRRGGGGTTTTEAGRTTATPRARPGRRPVHPRGGVGRSAARTPWCSGPGSPRIRWPTTGSAACPTRRSTSCGRWRATRASPTVVRSGVAVGRAGPRPRGARRRRRSRAGHRLPLPVHGRRAHQPGGAHPDAARRVAGPLRPRRRQLPVVRDGRLRRLPPPARRGRRPRAAPRRLHLRVRRAPPTASGRRCPPTSWRRSPTTGCGTRRTSSTRTSATRTTASRSC